MILRTFGYLVITVSMIVVGVATMTQELSVEEREQLDEMLQGKNRQNFSGWGGILFYCSLGDTQIHTLKEICDRTNTNADFLAAAAKVKMVVARNAFEFGTRSVLDDLLSLEVTLTATKLGSPAAVHATIRAYRHYSKATESTSLGQPEDKTNEPGRSGDLVLWEQSVIGASSGTTEELVSPVADGIDQHLKQFFADYLKAIQ